MIRLPLVKKWRWWILAGAAVLVIRRLERKPPSLKQANIPEDGATPGEAVARRARAADELRDIFALARRFVASRAVQEDVARDACLLRAAEVVLKSAPAAAAFVATHREAFLSGCKEGQAWGKPDCEKCGAPMHEASNHDEALDEWMPVWTCARCGAQVTR